jgi:hypothetical protein
MKFRIFALILSGMLAAWLPAVGQQSSAPQQTTPPAEAAANPTDASKPTAKAVCCCLELRDHTGRAAAGADHNPQTGVHCCAGKHGQSVKSMACYQKKDAENMACCSNDNKQAESAMECPMAEDNKMGSANEGGSCCHHGDRKVGKSCCGKEASAAHVQAGRNCCEAGCALSTKQASAK